jgi:hypothetical protein
LEKIALRRVIRWDLGVLWLAEKVWRSVRKFSGLKLFGWNNPHELLDETGTGSRGKRDSDKDTGLRSAGRGPLIK